MKDFEYLNASSLEIASKYLLKNKNSYPFAGGTDLLGLMKDYIVSPDKLVNIKSLQELNSIYFDEEEGLKIGALTKLSDIEKSDIIGENYSALKEAVKEVATPQLRNIGTIGGNICQRPRCFYFRGDYDCIRKGGDTCFALTGNNKYHCIIGGDPCYIVHPSDTAVALLALNAKFKIFSNGKEKIIPADKFFLLPEEDETKENTLNRGEILTEIIIPPLDSDVKSSYIKIKERGTWDFALVSISAVLKLKKNIVETGQIAFGGVAPIPWMDNTINEKLSGLVMNEENINKLSSLAFDNADPLEMNSYKVILTKNLIKKILHQYLQQN